MRALGIAPARLPPWMPVPRDGDDPCRPWLLLLLRFRFVRFAADEQQATTLGLLAECFEFLGGVPKKVLATGWAV